MHAKLQLILLRLVEFVLLIPAFGLLIPPVPSEVDERYPVLPRLALAAGLLACSLTLACRRKGEHWTVALLKLVLFALFGWLVYLRVGM
jgi:hypothetical protein